jgi:hypothetical protein
MPATENRIIDEPCAARARSPEEPVDQPCTRSRRQNAVGVTGGKHLVSVSAAVRKETGLKGGDPIAVTPTATDKPRPVIIPKDIGAAFKNNPAARKFFDGLPNSMQRYHIDNIEAAKGADTRQRAPPFAPS